MADPRLQLHRRLRLVPPVLSRKGRRAVPRGVYMRMFLRWGVFLRKEKAKNAHRRIPAIATDFMAAELEWFRDNGIAASDYPTFANMLTKGRREREREATRRRREWQIRKNYRGVNFISTDPYIRAVAEFQYLYATRADAL